MGGMETSHERLNTLGDASAEALLSRTFFFARCAFTVASLEDNTAQTCLNEGENNETNVDVVRCFFIVHSATEVETGMEDRASCFFRIQQWMLR